LQKDTELLTIFHVVCGDNFDDLEQPWIPRNRRF